MSDPDFFFLIGAGVMLWVLGPILYFAFRGYFNLQHENRRLRARLVELDDDVYGDITRLPNRG